MKKSCWGKYFRSVVFYFGVILLILRFGGFSVTRDPDLGWHIRYGEEISVTRQEPKIEKFTYTLNGTKWRSGEWIGEEIEYLVFKQFGLVGLSILSLVIVSVAIMFPLILFRAEREGIVGWLAVWLLLLTSRAVFGIGMRVQILGILLLSIVVSLLWKFLWSENRKFLYPLPFLIWIWSNVHASYLLGIGVVSVVLVIYYSQKRKHFKTLLLIGGLVLCSYWLRTDHIFDSIGELMKLVRHLFTPASSTLEMGNSVRRTIAEWLPVYLPTVNGLGYFGLILWSLSIFLMLPAHSFLWSEVFLVFFFIYTSSLAKRNFPFFGIVILPMLVRYTPLLLSEFKRRLRSWKRLELPVMLLLMLVVSKGLKNNLSDVVRVSKSPELYCQKYGYPCQAIEYLKGNPPEGRMLNYYNWGGYLIWNLPEQKVFIDGRMPGGDLFREYETLQLVNKGWEELIDKYTITWAIMPKQSLLAQKLKEDKGWIVVYEDELAVVVSGNSKVLSPE